MVGNYLYSILLIILLILIITGHIICYFFSKEKSILLSLFGYIVYFVDELLRMVFNVFGHSLSTPMVAVLELCVDLLMTVWLFFLTKSKSGKKITITETLGIIIIVIGIIIFHFIGRNEMLRLIVYLWIPVTMYSVKDRDAESRIYFYTSIIMALLQNVRFILYFIMKIPLPFYSISVWSELLLYCYFFIGFSYVYLKIKQYSRPVKELNKTQRVQAFANKYDLTPREYDVLCLLLAGKSNTKIGEELFVSEGTVKAHVHSIYRKAGINSRSMLFAAIVSENINHC